MVASSRVSSHIPAVSVSLCYLLTSIHSTAYLTFVVYTRQRWSLCGADEGKENEWKWRGGGVEVEGRSGSGEDDSQVTPVFILSLSFLLVS